MADQAAALNAIPAQYQGQLDQVALRKALAQALLKQGIAGSQKGQMVGGRYIAPSPLSYGADLISSLGGVLAMRQATQDQTDIQNQYQTDRAADLAKVMSLQQGTPATPAVDPGTNATTRPDLPADLQPQPGYVPGQGPTAPNEGAAIQAALSSQFTQISALGKTMADSRDKRLGEVIKMADPTSAIAFGQSGDTSLLKAGAVGAPQEVKDGQGNTIGTYVTQPDGKVSWVPKGQTINNNLGDKGALDFVKGYIPDLVKGRDNSIAAQTTLQGTSVIRDLLNNGPVNTGSGADWMTRIQKAGQVLGFPVPADAANNERWKAEITPMIAARAKAFGTGNGFTDKDAELVGASLANPGQDPRAANAILDRMDQQANQTVTDHRNFVDAVKKAVGGVGVDPSVVDPYAFTPATVPHTPPSQNVPASPAEFPQVSAATQSGRNDEQLRILRQEQADHPEYSDADKAALQADIDRITRMQAANTPFGAGTSSRPARNPKRVAW